MKLQGRHTVRFWSLCFKLDFILICFSLHLYIMNMLVQALFYPSPPKPYVHTHCTTDAHTHTHTYATTTDDAAHVYTQAHTHTHSSASHLACDICSWKALKLQEGAGEWVRLTPVDPSLSQQFFCWPSSPWRTCEPHHIFNWNNVRFMTIFPSIFHHFCYKQLRSPKQNRPT